jgi:hypothetical protein
LLLEGKIGTVFGTITETALHEIEDSQGPMLCHERRISHGNAMAGHQKSSFTLNLVGLPQQCFKVEKVSRKR